MPANGSVVSLGGRPNGREEGIIMRRSLIIIGLTVTLFAAGTAVAAEPSVVLDKAGVNEFRPSASEGYLVWSANSLAHPRRTNSYVRPDGESKIRVNPQGTQSFGASIDGTTVVYQEAGHDDADLGLFDAVSQTRSSMPDGVNTRNYESSPTLSGDWLLFTRTNLNRVDFADARVSVILFNMTTEQGIVLRDLTENSHYMMSDQVSGDYATFESCRWDRAADRYSNCQAFLYEISTEELVRIENPGVQQYAAGVTDDGTVYVVRSGGPSHWQCGTNARIVRYPEGGGPGVVIARLRDPRDVLATFALEETGGSTSLYFGRLNCETGRTGLYVVRDADTA
jgi:hypothetical protein